MMAYKRPLVNWARIPGYWWVDSWDSLCSLHLCLTTGTDCTEKGAPHVHFFSLPSFLNGRNIPSRLKKGSENETFLHIFTWLHVFHGWKKPAPSRHQLRWTTFWTWIFGPALGVSDGRFGFARSKRHMDDDPPRFYLGHITYISPTTGFVDVWGRCMIWWLSILDGCDKPSWPLLLFDVDAVFCCRGIAGRMCSCRKLSKPQAVDEMAVTCSILVHWSTLGIRNAGSLDSC